MANSSGKTPQQLSDDYSKFQTDLQDAISARQRLQAQESENVSVQNEFVGLTDSSNIYKLVGPVLLKQEKAEASMAVDGRLEYIRGEIKRIDGNIKEIQEKSENVKMELYQMQLQQQQQQQSGEQPAAA